jgi:hypothetical protein
LPTAICRYSKQKNVGFLHLPWQDKAIEASYHAQWIHTIDHVSKTAMNRRLTYIRNSLKPKLGSHKTQAEGCRIDLKVCKRVAVSTGERERAADETGSGDLENTWIGLLHSGTDTIYTTAQNKESSK